MNPSSTPTTRRNWLFGMAGIGAAAVGASLAWRREDAQAATAATVSPVAQAFWSASFEKLGGGQLAAASLRGKPLLVNFWASWCAPCVKELPEIAQFAHETPGWQVLGLAVDSPDPVREFLKKTPLDFPLALAGMTGSELGRKLGNTQGGLPFSVAFNSSGEVFWQKIGATNLQDLRQLAKRKT